MTACQCFFDTLIYDKFLIRKFKIDLRVCVRVCVCVGSQWESSTGVGADATYARELLMQGQNAEAVICSFCNLAVSLCVYL